VKVQTPNMLWFLITLNLEWYTSL